MSMIKIARRHNTDKSFLGYPHYYEKFIDIRPRNVLDIGILNGGSLQMWREFYECTVYGVDIEQSCVQFESDGVKIRIGSQDDQDFLMGIWQETLPAGLDLIVDDASHRAKATVQTFGILWPLLNPGGFYICEDTYYSFVREYVDSHPTPIEVFKSVVDRLNVYDGKERRIPDHSFEYVIFIRDAVILKKRCWPETFRAGLETEKF